VNSSQSLIKARENVGEYIFHVAAIDRCSKIFGGRVCSLDILNTTSRPGYWLDHAKASEGLLGSAECNGGAILYHRTASLFVIPYYEVRLLVRYDLRFIT
jgi:hypothetical protein